MSQMKFGIVHRPKSGHHISGDAYLIKEGEKTTLVCLVDGLGSGKAAAEAAQAAIRCVEVSSTLPLSDIMAQCHRALRGTRGAVMALLRVSFSESTITFVGVGNIGIHVRSTAPIKPISKNGIVGYRLPRLQEFTYPYTPGDLFVLHTDGISSRFILNDGLWQETQDVQTLADEIAQKFGKDNDDITALVARWQNIRQDQGAPSELKPIAATLGGIPYLEFISPTGETEIGWDKRRGTKSRHGTSGRPGTGTE